MTRSRYAPLSSLCPHLLPAAANGCSVLSLVLLELIIITLSFTVNQRQQVWFCLLVQNPAVVNKTK